MWVQLEMNTFDRLAALAEEAAMPDVAAKIRQSLSKERLTSSATQRYREAARRLHGEEGTLEIDDDAVVSVGHDLGAYVMAWRWIDSDSAADFNSSDRGVYG